jgi:hypothetical protein
VLGRQVLLHLRAQVLGDLGEPASVQDPHGGDGAHDGDLGPRPGEAPWSRQSEREFMAMYAPP